MYLAVNVNKKNKVVNAFLSPKSKEAAIEQAKGAGWNAIQCLKTKQIIMIK